MDNNLDIPELNPIKYYDPVRVQPVNHLSRFMDEWAYRFQIRNYEAPAYYWQPWMQSDTVRQQFSPNYGPITLQLMNCEDQPVLTSSPGVATTSIIKQPYIFLQSFIALNSVPAGIYYFMITAGVDTEIKYYVSEPIEISEIIENTLLLTYSHNENDYDVAFDTGIVFEFRVEGIVTDFQPGHKSRVFDDQNLNPVRLSSYPFRSYKCITGGPAGHPDWVADKINRIFGLDNVLIDGKTFVRTESSIMERKGEVDYPMAAWSFDIREGKNKRSTRFTSPQSNDNFSNVVYNINSKLFGDLAGPASNTEVTIIRVE